VFAAGPTAGRADRAGVRIVAGTDAPIDPFGMSLHMELAHYQESGLTPFQALQTATVNAAEALGMSADLGTIEPGKLADLIAVAADPLDDIRNLRRLLLVFKEGRIVSDKRGATGAGV
jgi:imidazolonepropionase-like amidohydrolase